MTMSVHHLCYIFRGYCYKVGQWASDLSRARSHVLLFVSIEYHGSISVLTAGRLTAPASVLLTGGYLPAYFLFIYAAIHGSLF